MACQTPFRDDPQQLLLYKIASCLAEGGGGGGVSGVASFNLRTGVVTLTSGDVTTALGFTPISQADGDSRYVLKAGDTMTGSLAMPAGSAALPSNTFSGDLNTGMYSPGADSVGFATGGTLRLTIASAGVTSSVPILLPDGTAALPALTFQSDTDTGIYRIGANSFGSAAGGSVILATSTTGINLTTALAYQYNSVNVIRAQTALNNYFFGPSGNLTGTGTGNTAVGNSAFPVFTTGLNNTAIGNFALLANTTGTSNTAIGTLALAANTVAGNGVAIGQQALAANVSGNNNVAIGYQALIASTGPQNSGMGSLTFADLTSGSLNSAVGYNTGRGITTGAKNTIIGANVAGLAAALSNNIILADGDGVIRLQIDSSGNTTLAGTVATAAGTAALPAHTFSADLNTGLYNIGADSLGLSTGGTLRTTTNTTDLILATGFRLAMASGANTRAGNATLVAGTVTVANTSVTANTIVMLTRKTSGGTLGTAITYTVIAATSFTINSDSALDTSTFSYVLIENP